MEFGNLSARGGHFAAADGNRRLLFAVRLLASLADIDSALEERAVFNGDARGHYIPGQRAVAANVDTVAGGKITANFSEHNDFPGVDIGCDHAIAAHSYAISRQVNRAFDPAINVK